MSSEYLIKAWVEAPRETHEATVVQLDLTNLDYAKPRASVDEEGRERVNGEVVIRPSTGQLREAHL